MRIHQKHREWLEIRGLNPELAESFGISTHRDGTGYWLKVPYLEGGREVNAKFRLSSDKRHRMVAGAPLTWWNIDCLLDQRCQQPGNPVVITEGEWDALTAIQAGYQFVLSVPNGAPEAEAEADPTDAATDQKRYGFFWRGKRLTDGVARFIVATDADEPGRILASELVRRLGVHRCFFVTFPDGCKDLNEVLCEHGVDEVRRILDEARPYPVRGLYALEDFPDPPELRPFRVRLPGLFDVWPIVPGTFTVITGYAGQGKTSLILACMADLIQQGVPVAIGSFETSPKPILQRSLRGHLSAAHHSHLTATQIEAADAMLAERLRIIAQHPESDQDEMTLDEVLDLAAVAVHRDGVKVLLLDPWNEIEHKRRTDETETEYTGRAIRAMKRFARQYDVAIILVAHPKKPDSTAGKSAKPTLYDISGSANFANKADYGITIYRSDRDRPLVMFDLIKVRMGLPGRMESVELEWSWANSRYVRPSLTANDD